MDYLEYWQLGEKPFEEVRNPKFFYESEDHREALDRLLYVVNDKNMGFGLLTGEIGSGKTITQKVLDRKLPRHEYEVVSLDSFGFEFNNLLYEIMHNITFRHVVFDLAEGKLEDRRSDMHYLLTTFKKYLQHLNETEQRHLVVIIDEAQQISDSALDDLKNLTNIGTEQKNYLTILLIGQPELREKIRSLQQLDQRISLRFHLNNLDIVNTQKYISHRLRVAGCPREDIFTNEALEALFKDTHGVPREINRACKLTLDYGFTISVKEIGGSIMSTVLADIHKHG